MTTSLYSSEGETRTLNLPPHTALYPLSYIPSFTRHIFTDRAGRLTKLSFMNLRMALFTKSYQTTQMFQFMSDNRHTAYLVGFMMNLQIIGLATHPATVSVTNTNLTFYFFPIGVILQTRLILRRPSFLVLQSRHSSPLFSMDFLQSKLCATHGVV